LDRGGRSCRWLRLVWALSFALAIFPQNEFERVYAQNFGNFLAMRDP
jgi:hypothetical protein